MRVLVFSLEFLLSIAIAVIFLSEFRRINDPPPLSGGLGTIIYIPEE
jgi:hypothetical protein